MPSVLFICEEMKQNTARALICPNENGFRNLGLDHGAEYKYRILTSDVGIVRVSVKCRSRISKLCLSRHLQSTFAIDILRRHLKSTVRFDIRC